MERSAGFVSGALGVSQQAAQSFGSASARDRLDAGPAGPRTKGARATCSSCGARACLCTPSYGSDSERKHLKFAPRAPGMASFAGLRPVNRLGRTLRRTLEECDANAELLQRAASSRGGEEAIAVAPRAVMDFIKNLIPGGTRTSSNVSAYQGRVKRINEMEAGLLDLPLEELKAKSMALRERVQASPNESGILDEVLPEAFALVREVSRQVLGLRHFDVQFIGGMVLHERRIAEMKTGEGKTLVATLPAYLNALSGRGVHIVTVNDYLARRDQEIMGQVFRALGLNVGLIQNGMEPAERRKAYACDITYCTNSELGFDYLRDNMALDAKDLVQRPFNFCIVDEVDSILIDEARTPLIISGQGDLNVDRYKVAAYVADQLRKGPDYEVNEKQKSAQLTDGGWRAIEGMLGVQPDADMQTKANFISEWSDYCNAAIRAKELFRRDKQYIVKDGEVVIVDEFTGRVMPGRRWSDGLHQAIEAKEGVEIQPESKTIASISYQALFKLFPRLSGMTGTALTEEAEFLKIYDLPVIAVPTNKKLMRADESDQVYVTQEAKWNAVVEECEAQYRAGRPVLIGTTNVAYSELLSKRFDERGIPHQVLNARPEVLERESEIIAQAGRMGQLTIATNMAGRGTDIILGGNPTFMARLRIREELFPAVVQQHDSKGVGRVKDWKVTIEGFYPTELSAAVQKDLTSAVDAAKKAYPEGIDELAAEELLAICGEKVDSENPLVKALQKAFESVRSEYSTYTELEKEKVVELGGLYILGTERHESRRIDNQLRGRAGRQGDPGTSRFFLSLEDDLLRIFGGPKMQAMFRTMKIDESLPIASKTLTASLDQAQKKVENYYFDTREQLFKFDEPMTAMRSSFYDTRRKILTADEDMLADLVCDWIDDVVDMTLVSQIASKADKAEGGGVSWAPRESWQLSAVVNVLRYFTADLLTVGEEELRRCEDVEALKTLLYAKSEEAYDVKFVQVEKIRPGLMKELERYVMLTNCDEKWQKHLRDMRSLQERNRLAYYRQRDPLVEYRTQGMGLFDSMIEAIKKESVWQLFNVRESGPAEQSVPPAQATTSPAIAAPAPAPNGSGNGSAAAAEAVAEVQFAADAAEEAAKPELVAAASPSPAPSPAKGGKKGKAAKGGKKGKGRK